MSVDTKKRVRQYIIQHLYDKLVDVEMSDALADDIMSDIEHLYDKLVDVEMSDALADDIMSDIELVTREHGLS